MDKTKVVEELWDKYDGRCAHCGALLDKKSVTVGHIFPHMYGGSSYIENLELLCDKCSVSKKNSSFLSEMEFRQYLYHFLLHDNRFKDVRSGVCTETVGGKKDIFDIMFSRTINGHEEQFIVEVKNMVAATALAIERIIRQLAYYQSICPDCRIILAVPMTLAREYRQRISAAGVTLWDSETLRLGIPDSSLLVHAGSNQCDELIYRLKQCQPGYESWQIYQKLVGEILSVLFCPPLDPVSEQNADRDYTNRRDFILPNYSTSGYWYYLRNRYQAEFIVVDAKNSAGGVKKSDILQVAHYLKAKGAGLLGLIFSRCEIGESTETHLRDIWQQEGKMIVVLSDSDVEQMLLNKQKDIDPCRVIIEKIQEFRLKI